MYRQMDILGINQLVTDDTATEFMGQTNNNWDLNAIVRNGMTARGRSSTDCTEPTINPFVTASIDNETSNDAQMLEKSFSCAPALGIHGFEVDGQPVIPNDGGLYGFLNHFPLPDKLLAPPQPTHFIAHELCQQQITLSRQLSLQKQQLQLEQRQQPGPQTPTRKCLKKKRSEGALGNNKICRRVLGEDLQTLDKWAWRKYGQKPIKGTPYQRSYYKCSTKKNCTAKKLVERIQTEPDTFIVSYYGEHFHQPPAHRNALAGLTRRSSIINSMPTVGGFVNKPQEFRATTCDQQPSSCLQATTISPTAPLGDPGNLTGTADEMTREIIHVPTTNRRGSSEKPRGDDPGKVDVERELTLLIPNPMAMVGEEMMFGGINQYEERTGNGSTSGWRW